MADPTDAKSLVTLAAEANGLGSPDLKPWNLKAHYQVYDARGKNPQQGTLEVAWASGDHYRITFAGQAYVASYQTIGPDNYRLGGFDYLPYPREMMVDLLLHPVHRPLAQST